MPQFTGPPLIGIFGGTFDPVHNGHLRVALDVLELGGLDALYLMPCHVPPHRATPMVDSAQRLQLLRLAVRGEPRMRVDARELDRDGPSYTLDTLTSLRADYPRAHLCLLLGTDSFRSLPGWDRWRQLTDHAHIVVMQRPETEDGPDAVLDDWLQGRETRDWGRLRHQQAGCVLYQPVTQLAISATDIRARLAAGRSARFLMPDAVWDHVQKHALYVAGDSRAGSETQ